MVPIVKWISVGSAIDCAHKASPVDGGYGVGVELRLERGSDGAELFQLFGGEHVDDQFTDEAVLVGHRRGEWVLALLSQGDDHGSAVAFAGS
ncbi:hypothetical protein DEI92_01080 [Curtobacterium sp. MCBD17_034]|nr:hypothetical protein DEI92_01080 [Curtobacterium sp. MCBD17_034]PZM33930.1 hypothetical protein DEI90_09620 [Curtobacterium sp. MCBD17_031]